MTIEYISENRLRDHTQFKRLLAKTIVRASVFPLVITGNMNAGDIMGPTLLYDAEFLGAWWDQDADEGTDGTAIIQKWDDVTGSGYQTSISATLTVDAGAASLEWMAPLTSGVEICAAGDKLNVVTTGIDGAPNARVTMWFAHINDPTV